MKRVMASMAQQARRQALARRRSRAHLLAHSRTRPRRYTDSGRWRGRGSTLLALVQEVQRHFENDADVVRAIRYMVNSGAVVLTGNFAGARF